MGVCKIFPHVHACMEYIAARPMAALEALQQHRKNNHPATQCQSRDRLVNVLRGEILLRQQADGAGWWDDIESIVENVTDQYHSGHGDLYEEAEDYRPSIYQAHMVDGSILRPPWQDDDHYLVPEVQEAVQPVRYPFWVCEDTHIQADPEHIEELLQATILEATDHTVEEPDTAAEEDNSTEERRQAKRQPLREDGPRTITLTTTRIELRRDLADTGASISVTGIRSILHKFQPHSDYQIEGYDGQVTKAAGQGYAHIYNPATKQINEMLFVYTPTVSGTIISLEHHAKTHPRIHRWTQEATPSDDSGWIMFLAEDGTVVSLYHTIRAGGGLYYIQDLNFIPAPPTSPSHHQSICPVSPTPSDCSALTLRVTMMQGFESTDYTPSLDTEHTAYLLGDQVTPSNALCLTQIELHATYAGKNVLQYELWHQRMGHAPASRLHKTAKHVQGLPTMHAQHLLSFVRCACDIAKLKKAPRGNALPDPPTLQTGQCFQMDIGFIRGPSNLQAVVDWKEEAQSKVINICHNFVCYLVVMDRKLRYMWAFLLRSRSVPMDLLITFLAIHGAQTVTPRIMRTDGEGSLAESIDFRNLL